MKTREGIFFTSHQTTRSYRAREVSFKKARMGKREGRSLTHTKRAASVDNVRFALLIGSEVFTKVFLFLVDFSAKLRRP
jgi:hypothetical protein